MDNDNNPLIITAWPQAIVHIDGDAFFASCEQAMHPKYKGKPIVTGGERGIAAALSYEAKALGVHRGMSIFEIKKRFPSVIIVPSDYESYGLISNKMFSIMRSFTSEVEEYSIDEGFADITGLRRPMNASYGVIAQSMKEKIESALGITVSVGVSVAKTLAKCASEFRKPNGFVVMPGNKAHLYLSTVSIEDVWGIGPATSAYLRKYSIKTALDFAKKSEEFVQTHLTKPGWETWCELRGHSVYKVDSAKKEEYKSISKVQTFAPSADRRHVYAHLIHNLDRACAKAHRFGLAAREVIAFLKKQTFQAKGVRIRLTRPTNNPLELSSLVGGEFEGLFEAGVLYRTTGIILLGLHHAQTVQFSLFEDVLQIEKKKRVFEASSSLNNRFGRGSVFLASEIPYFAQGEKHKGRKQLPLVSSM